MELADDPEAGVGTAGYRFLTGGAFGGKGDESKVPELRAAFEERLGSLEVGLYILCISRRSHALSHPVHLLPPPPPPPPTVQGEFS